MERPIAGAKLGNFHLLEWLGEGAMAVVFRAEQEHTQRQVALKVLHNEFCSRMDVVRRFCQEALIVKRAWHPNILDINEVVYGESHPPFLIMELLHGEDLGACLDRRGALPPELAIDITLQTCSALEAIHSRNIIHRDLKPGNLFLVGGDEGYPIVKLLDFGLAKLLYEDDPYMRSRPGAFIGTPEYMAPEQIRGGEMDDLVDVYAMGALLYEMLSGQPPFIAKEFSDKLKLALTARPEPPSKIRAAVDGVRISPLLDEIVLRCLEKRPDRRFQSISELKSVVEGSLDSASTATLPPPPGQTSPWLYAVAGLLAAGLMGLAAYLVLG